MKHECRPHGRIGRGLDKGIKGGEGGGQGGREGGREGRRTDLHGQVESLRDLSGIGPDEVKAYHLVVFLLETDELG
jgi:hypothetical protein